MPRKRRQPDLGDALAYAVNRREKLKGPKKALYAKIVDALLEEVMMHGHDERTVVTHQGKVVRGLKGLCEECNGKLG